MRVMVSRCGMKGTSLWLDLGANHAYIMVRVEFPLVITKLRSNHFIPGKAVVYCKRGNFRVGEIFAFFPISTSSRKFPPRENKTQMTL